MREMRGEVRKKTPKKENMTSQESKCGIDWASSGTSTKKLTISTGTIIDISRTKVLKTSFFNIRHWNFFHKLAVIFQEKCSISFTIAVLISAESLSDFKVCVILKVSRFPYFIKFNFYCMPLLYSKCFPDIHS